MKKMLPLIIIVFAVYIVVMQPAHAVSMMRSAFDGLAAGGHSIKKFFDALTT